MTKPELVKSVAQKAGIKQKDAESAVDAFIEAITEAVKKGEEVKLLGFGSFLVVERAPKQGKNPQTGEAIEIPARKAVVFRAGRCFKSAVN